MTVIGPIAMLTAWLTILVLGNGPAVAVACAAPVLLALAVRQLMPRTVRPVPPSEPAVVDIEERRIRSFAESLRATSRKEGTPHDGQR